MVKEGDRIGALLSLNSTQASLIGYGTYQGRSPDNPLGFPNPKLVMDDGTVAWGYECWWGPEDKIKEKIKGLEIIPIDMKKHRQKD